MSKKLYILFVALTIVMPAIKGQSTDIQKDNTDIQKDNNMKKQVLIDKFFVPKNSIEEFSQRINYNRSFIKKLPGFIKDEAYRQIDGEGNLTIITVAIWKDHKSIDNAKLTVQAEYKRIGFNPVEFYQRLNIKMERGIFNELED